MPADLPAFSWGVGIEDTFIPQIRPGHRALDEYELTGHYARWREDFDLLAELGVNHIRWGVPWYKVNPAPGVFDWTWIDEVLDYLVNKVKVTPIIDLMHYGTPLWLENSFINVHYPERVAEYSHAFAERYGELVRYYTPLNEPMVNALFCGRLGQWPPYLEGEDGYVKVLMQVARGVELAGEAIIEADPDAIIVQVEALEYHWTADERLREHVFLEQEQIYLAYDLFTGRVSEQHPLWPYLHEHGVTSADLDWLRQHHLRVDVLGMNYYSISGGEWRVGEDGKPLYIRGVGLEQMDAELRDVWNRYKLPIMITEINTRGSDEVRLAWMDGSIALVRKAIAEGIPVTGYTWWPLFDSVGWTYRMQTGRLRSYVGAHGLWSTQFRTLANVQRRPRRLAWHFKDYVTGKL